MSAIVIERNNSDLVVYGQIQCDFSVTDANGVKKSGLEYGVAALESAFARSVVYEQEMAAVAVAIKKRQEKVLELNKAMGYVNATLTWLGAGKGDSRVLATDLATKKTTYKDEKGNEHMYYTADGIHQKLVDIAKRYGLSQHNTDEKKGETEVKLYSFAQVQMRQADLRAAIETENNEIQRTTSFAKTLISKRDSATQQISKIMKKTWSPAKLVFQSIGY